MNYQILKNSGLYEADANLDFSQAKKRANACLLKLIEASHNDYYLGDNVNYGSVGSMNKICWYLEEILRFMAKTPNFYNNNNYVPHRE